jgi:hypothetical protein
MKHFLTHYWSAPTVEFHRDKLRLEGDPCSHTAGNQFSHVRPGDDIYVISRTADGDLLLLGRLTASAVSDWWPGAGRHRAIFTQREAARALNREPGDLWEANHHLVSMESKDRATTLSFQRVIAADDAVEQLRFSRTADDAEVPPKLEADGVLDRQTVRGVRRLTDDSAKWLDELL